MSDRPTASPPPEVAAVLAGVLTNHYAANHDTCACGRTFSGPVGWLTHATTTQAAALTAAGLVGGGTSGLGVEESVRELTDYGPEGCI